MPSNQAKIILAALVLILAGGCGLTLEQARAEIEDRGLTFDEAGIGNAVLSEDTELLELFITAGYDVNAFDNPGRAPLTLSTRLSRWPTMKLLINAGARAEALPGVLITPASRGDLRTMSLLLDAGADIDSMDRAWRTAMLGAIENGKVEAVRFLLDNGANPDGGRSSGRHGGNPLITAIKTHQPETAELLIAADRRRPTGPDGDGGPSAGRGRRPADERPWDRRDSGGGTGRPPRTGGAASRDPHPLAAC